MNLLHEALRSGHAMRPVPATARRVLVAGGAGALGAAVLETLLARPEFAQVAVLVIQPLNAALRGLATVSHDLIDQPTPAPEDTAVVVFDRVRHANGREQAFLRPQPQELPALAAQLRSRGVRRLIVVMPHASASLPEALKRGLANLDEQAVCALGFEQLVFVRSAQARASVRTGHVLQRLVDAVLAQLQLMIPQREQPVRASRVARFTAELAAQLHEAPPATRVVPPELVWLAAQTDDVAGLARAWLHGRALPESTPPRARM